ncbi:hypothetical protein TNMX_12870 [Thermus sp. NMX2.A1]|jgi:hypothetical protein|nr:hypothetical protein TNMX_12870 [Thermus sp. NMX2.A1]
MPEGFVEVVEEEGFTHLPITPVHAMVAYGRFVIRV